MSWGTAAARAAARCRSRLPGPKLGSIAFGGEEKGVRPGAVPVGNHHRGETAPLALVEQVVDLARVEQRRVSRHEQRPVEAAADGVADADQRRGRLTHLGVVAERLHAVAEGGGVGDAVAGHHHDPVEPAHPRAAR